MPTFNESVTAISNLGFGVKGVGPNVIGVHGSSANLTGVFGESESGFGTHGRSTRNIGVHGRSTSSTGMFGESDSGFGVHGRSTNGTAVLGEGPTAGRFVGRVEVFGDFTVANGRKRFKIDHPLDPQNKYLLHSSVESSEMKNVYDGVAQLDADGTASVELPEWFEALNGDFRYQLTAVGGAAPNLHVAEEVSENRFKIAGGEEGMKVCWQVTGTRKDPWAAANPFEVEQEKREEERGRYLDPGLYDAPEEQRVMVGPIAEAVEEEEIDELRRLEEEQLREVEELRRRMERQEEPPP